MLKHPWMYPLMGLLTTSLLACVFAVMVQTDVWFEWSDANTKLSHPLREIVTGDVSGLYLLCVVAFSGAFVLFSLVSKWAISRTDCSWMDTWCQEHGYDEEGNRLDKDKEMSQ